MSNINQGGGKKSGGCEAQGGPSHPPDFDRGVAPPPRTPLETASGYTWLKAVMMKISTFEFKYCLSF